MANSLGEMSLAEGNVRKIKLFGQKKTGSSVTPNP